MAGETILIVEDAPESLKFTAAILRGEGYKVQIASTAEQALSTLRFLQPNLLLVDFMLPGMNGLELVTRVKQDPRLQKTVIVALTACAMPGDETRARQAGCDGYLTKPIEGRALAVRIRQHLDHGGAIPGTSASQTGAPSSSGSLAGLPDSEVTELRDSFLKGGKGVSRQFLLSLDGQFDDVRARRTVHQWIGTAGLLGFSAVSQRAREVEDVLRTPPWNGRLRGPLTNLARSFYNPSGPLSEPPSQAAIRVLQGKRVALIGLSEDEADRMCTALEQVGARARLFEADQSPYAEAVGICQLVVVHVRPANGACRWLAREAPGLPSLPTIFLGATEHLLGLRPEVQARAGALLAEGCLIDETLMRLRLAMTQPAPAPVPAAAGSTGELVIADSEEASRTATQALLKEQGIPCKMANSGPDTILLLRGVQPPVAVVDVNMDGLEVLALIRAESLPVRTIFLTTQSQENEILRGFSLGAEDYLLQPYSPVELVARVKRLLG